MLNSERPSKAGTPVLKTALLKKRSFEQYMAANSNSSVMNSNKKNLVKAKPKLSTTTADITYDYRVTPQSDMKTVMTPYKDASCELTSQKLGSSAEPFKLEPYKRTCSGIGGYDSFNQTPVSKVSKP